MSKKDKRKSDRALSDRELQNIVDNDFVFSSDDEEEKAAADEFLSDEFLSDSDSDCNWEPGPDDHREDKDYEDESSSDGITSGDEVVLNNGNVDPNNGNANANDGNGQPSNQANAGANANGIVVDDDGWSTGLVKPKLLKFRGEEKVILNTAQPPVTPAEYFRLLFDDDMVRNIIKYTNEKAQALTFYKVQNRRSPLRNFKQINMREFQKFLGLCILMGNVAMPSMKHYWRLKGDLYRHPIFGQTMSRNRFETILRALRFYDTSNQKIAKKDKISYIINNCVKNFKKYYSPQKQLAIDEALLGFKGRLSYKQYIPLKRSRFGIKLYELSGSNGYILNIILYTGKGTVNEEGTTGHAYSVVMQLMKGYLGKGHALYLDNFYNSIPLAQKLLARGTQVTGTLRINRKGIPDIVKKPKLKRGESVFARKGSLLVQRWIDKKDVCVISTRHSGDFELVKAKFGPPKLKPKAIVEYNKYMGGVDKADQLTSYYTTPRKTIRWNLKVFFHMIDLCLWNSHYLYNFGKTAEEKITYLQFRDAVITEFFGELQPAVQPPVTATHYPVKMQARLRCRYCALANKRSASWYRCDTCTDRQKPVALCTKTDCFKKFHDEKLYRNLKK